MEEQFISLRFGGGGQVSSTTFDGDTKGESSLEIWIALGNI